LQQSQNSKHVTVNNAVAALEGALTGVFVQAMADANQTPSSANARGNLVIQCTGALTADRNLVLPNAKKTYVIHNLTTGGHNVVVKTASASATVSVGAGVQWVYCDGGNNFYAIA
jgi:hypothetical protein